jgi:predicted Zn-dependent peptidase
MPRKRTLLTDEERKKRANENSRRWYENNKARAREYHREYYTKRMHEDPEFRKKEIERIRLKKLKEAVDKMLREGRPVKG